MTFISYAQNFEDVLLWRALHDVENGHYLDIGAQDPVVDSVSLAFYTAGWRGVHVEPTPYYAARLREARPDEIVIEAAVTDATGPIEFYEIPDTGLSTGISEIAEGHSERGYPKRKIVVPCVRLDRLLEMTETDLHWLKIDVEGMEADALRSWGNTKRRPWLLIIESKSPNNYEPTHQHWMQDVHNRGYQQVFFDGLNRYFVHESRIDLKSKFADPANVFDAFAVASHHFSAAELRCEIERRDDQLRQEQAQMLELQTRQDHTQERAQQLEKRLNEALLALAAESKLRVEFDGREQQLRESLNQANEAAGSARAQLARLEERTANYEDKVALSEKLFSLAEARLDEAQRQIADLTSLLEQARGEAERQRAQQEMDLALGREAANQMRAELGEEIDHLHRMIGGADALIRTATLERPGLWQRAGKLLGFACLTPAWRALESWSLEAAMLQLSAGGSATIVNNLSHLRVRNPYLRANSLSELQSWDDVDFVRCAYVTLLGRQPDSEGEAYYTNRIRQGRTKMEVLWQLRRSAEARLHDPGIARLDHALQRAAWGRKPVVGAFVRAIYALEGDRLADRRHRMVMNELARLREHVSLGTVQQASTDELRNEVRRLTERVSAQPPEAALPLSKQTPSRSEQAPTSGAYNRLAPRAQSIYRQLIPVGED